MVGEEMPTHRGALNVVRTPVDSCSRCRNTCQGANQMTFEESRRGMARSAGGRAYIPVQRQPPHAAVAVAAQRSHGRHRLRRHRLNHTAASSTRVSAGTRSTNSTATHTAMRTRRLPGNTGRRRANVRCSLSYVTNAYNTAARSVVSTPIGQDSVINRTVHSERCRAEQSACA